MEQFRVCTQKKVFLKIRQRRGKKEQRKKETPVTVLKESLFPN